MANAENKIALTFDDGPHPYYTPQILAILEKYKVKATFFIVGENAEFYPEVLQQIQKSGHEIGNHTFTHCNIKTKTPKEIIQEIEKCRKAIFQICGENTVLFRPPGGLMTEVVASDAEILDNYNLIFWNIDTKDWTHRKADEIAEYVLNETKSGDIILMHDYISKNSSTPEALEIILPALLEKRFNFVTVSELIFDGENKETNRQKASRGRYENVPV